MIVSRPGNDWRSQRCASITASSSPGWVEVAATTGRSPIASFSVCSLLLSIGGAGTSSFRLPVTSTCGAPKLGEAIGIEAGLRKAEIEAADQRPGGALKRPPAMERTLGDAAVDDDQRNAPLGRRHDQVRPDIRLGEQGEIRLPAIEELRDEARHVERDELVDHVGRKPVAREIGRGHRAGCDQDREIQRAQALDQRQDGEQFADAGAMHPDQRAVGTLQFGFAAAFDHALRIFLAASGAIAEPGRNERRRDRRYEAVGAQGHRQSLGWGHEIIRVRRRWRKRARWRR